MLTDARRAVQTATAAFDEAAAREVAAVARLGAARHAFIARPETLLMPYAAGMLLGSRASRRGADASNGSGTSAGLGRRLQAWLGIWQAVVKLGDRYL